MNTPEAKRFLRRASIAAMQAILSTPLDPSKPDLTSPQTVAAMSVDYAVALLSYEEGMERNMKGPPAA